MLFWWPYLVPRCPDDEETEFPKVVLWLLHVCKHPNKHTWEGEKLVLSWIQAMEWYYGKWGTISFWNKEFNMFCLLKYSHPSHLYFMTVECILFLLFVLKYHFGPSLYYFLYCSNNIIVNIFKNLCHHFWFWQLTYFFLFSFMF